MRNKVTGIKLIGIWLALVLVILCIIPGCGPSRLNSSSKSDSKSTITITDCAGRLVEVPAQVERIACLYAFSGHVFTLLGKGDHIVATVEGLKRDKLLTQMYPAILEASVPVTSGAINIEELLKTKPDIVFIRGEIARNEAEMEKLEKSGLCCLAVDYNNMKDQQYAINMIGEAIGASDLAADYNRYYRESVERVRQRVANIPAAERTRVYHSVNEATRTDTRDSLPADWLAATGVDNVSLGENLKLLEGKYYAGLEQILLWDPEFILCNEAGVADYILTNPQWRPLQAVKNKKVLQLPNGISRWGHPGSLETPLAVMWTAKTVYPQLFTDLDMEKETALYYQRFYNYELTPEDVKHILSGQGMRIPKQRENSPKNT